MATTTARRRWMGLAAPAGLDGRMLLGVALVAASVVGGLLFWGSTSETVPVLVAARDFPAGHTIQADDLSVARVRLEGSLSSLAVREGELDQVVGHTAGTTVHAGEMVVWPDLASGPIIGPNDVAVTVPVEADAVYPGLRPGDTVAVLATTNKGKPESRTVTLLERAVVYHVSLEPGRIAIGRGADGAEADRGLTNVTLVVPKSEAELLAHAVVNGDVTLALLAPESGSGTSAP